MIPLPGWGWVNRYTVGGAIALVVLSVLFLQFGASISSWSAGVYKALKGNREAEQKLQQSQAELINAQAENQKVLQDYATAQAAVRNLSQQIMTLKQRSDQAVAAAQAKDATISQLRNSVTRLEQQRKALPAVRSLQEAKDALATFNPVYR